MPSRRTNSERSGLTLPVGRILTMLRVESNRRVSTAGGVYFTAVLEYLTAEMLELALNAARSEGSYRLKSRHLNMALRADPEFLPMFRKAVFAHSSYYPAYDLTRKIAEGNGPVNRDVEGDQKPVNLPGPSSNQNQTPDSTGQPVRDKGNMKRKASKEKSSSKKKAPKKKSDSQKKAPKKKSNSKKKAPKKKSNRK